MYDGTYGNSSISDEEIARMTLTTFLLLGIERPFHFEVFQSSVDVDGRGSYGKVPLSLRFAASF